jgi:hypothetical protein
MRRAFALLLVAACGSEEPWDDVRLSECFVTDYFVRLNALNAAMSTSDVNAAAIAAAAMQYDLGRVFAEVCEPWRVTSAELVTADCSLLRCTFTLANTEDGYRYTYEGEVGRTEDSLDMIVKRIPPSLYWTTTTSSSWSLTKPMTGQGVWADGPSMLAVTHTEFAFEDIELDPNGCPIGGTFVVAYYRDADAAYRGDPSMIGGTAFDHVCTR